ncbi:MAG: carbohydrate-binding domain-containing protein, partial [Acutalibacteraceae bacterium]
MSCKRIVSIILSALFLAAVMTACTKESTDKLNTQAQTQSLDYSEMFSSSDMETGYDKATAGTITLADSGCVSKSSSVKVSDSGVVITSEGTYIISGTLTNGSITVEAQSSDKIRLIFDGVNINCDNSAAVYVKQADKVYITLSDGSENKLSNKTGFESSGEDNIDSVIFSKDDLTINGNGKLTVSSTGGHGIVSKDDLIITGGDYTVSASSHALSANDSVRVADGTFTLTSGKDGVHCENSEDT